jgi:hypothetical protein
MGSAERGGFHENQYGRSFSGFIGDGDFPDQFFGISISEAIGLFEGGGRHDAFQGNNSLPGLGRDRLFFDWTIEHQYNPYMIPMEPDFEVREKTD